MACPAFAQLSIGTVDPGPYTPGSTIAATFTIDPATCIAQGNVFQLWLSDASGNFASETQIGNYSSFYSTFVNGIIPIGTPAGTSYRLRIKSTNPANTSAPSTPIEIRAGALVESKLLSSKVHCNFDEAFGFPISQSGAAANIDLVNQSTIGGIVSATIHNENTGSNTILNFDTQQKSFNPEATHYTTIVKTQMPNGTVGTKAYFIINNKVNTSFTTSGSAYVCLPGGSLQYFIDVTSSTGIQNNFPGNTYKINWGDNTETTYTFCDLKSGMVTHNYLRSSCGQTYQSGNTTIFNAFGINVQVVSPFCGNVGTGVSTTAKVVNVTQNRFDAPTQACTNVLSTFVNTSILGEDPENTGPTCKPDNANFNWYVDGVLQKANQPKSFVFTYMFTAHGVHTVRLESTGTTGCPAMSYSQQICIQDSPQPAFNITSNTICAGTSITPTNTSVIDNICNNTSNYSWSVTPSAGVTYGGGTNSSSQQPQFIFNNSGIYQLMLTITTLSCGSVNSPIQTVVVNQTPTAILSPNAALCSINTYDFNPTTTGPTKTTFTGTAQDLSDTYEWSITGGASNFIGGNKNTKYPKIQFLDYATYTITVTHKNNCGTVTSNQIISFNPSPIVNAGPDQSICYNDLVTLNGSVTGTALSTAWVGGTGTFAPDRNTLNATYTPSSVEKANGQVTLILRATTSLSSPCDIINNDIIIIIKPNVTLNSATSKSICTGGNVTYTPTSTLTGATFNWVASGSANASGYSVSGTGNINDLLTNTDATTNATVTYLITPTANGCTGVPFTFTVTVTPKPIANASAINPAICSGQSAGITLTSNLPNTKYTWTSSNTAGITGNNANLTPTLATSINDILSNSGTSSGTATYTITPISDNGCAGTPFTITITIEPEASEAKAGSDISICDAASYTFNGNQPAVGTGLWTQVSLIAGVTINDANQYNATAVGLQPGNTYLFRWTISGAAGCSPKSDDVAITVNPISVGGTTTGATAVCAGINSGQITLVGHVGNVIRWESSTDGGVTYPNTITNTTTSLIYSNLITTTYYRAVVQSGVCATAFSTPSIINVNQGVTVANAGTDQVLCNATSVTLNANTPASPNTGLWTVTSGQSGVTFVNDLLPNTTVNGLIAGQTYTFRWTITASAPCQPSNDELAVNNLLALQTNVISSTNNSSCSGAPIIISGSSPTGGNGQFSYVWQSSPNGTSPWTTLAGQNGRDLNISAATNLSYQRIVSSGACTVTSNVITIIALPPISNNVITGNQNICLTQTPGVISGTLPTGGDGSNYTFTWDQSTDNGNTWSVLPNVNTQNYNPTAIGLTTLYRRLVSSSVCTGSSQSVSNSIKITVNLNAKAELTFTNDVGCIPFVLDANNIKAVPYPTQNATYTWFANGVSIGTGINFPGYTISTDNTNVDIKLVTTSSLGCLSSDTFHTFRTRQNVVASYTQTATTGCGPLLVNFNNTSTSLIGVTFEWKVDNTIVSTAADPGTLTFQADPAGNDKIYNISLRVTTPCGSTISASTVTVRPLPVAAFLPSKTIGCSPLTVTFKNTSPGTNTNYSYDFDDGTTSPATTSKADVSHTFITDVVKDFTVKMTATNECGTDTKSIVIRVSPNTITPALIVNGNQLRGCAPFTVNFINNSKGASKFTYTFEPGAVVIVNTVQTEIRPYTFTKAGTYTVNMLAENDCSSATAQVTVIVDPQPTIAFKGDLTKGCIGLAVKFTKNSTDAVSYTWDFGDGTFSNLPEPTHIYNGPASQYTVTLTAYNSLGCSTTVTLPNYITTVTPPIADFNISPAAVVSIPEYTFKFTDVSTNGAQTYKWSFGDGDISSLKDPTHKYTDTGKYLVTMRTYNEYGCVDSVQKSVQIVGVPGYVYLPNSFIPGGTSSPLQKFMAVGSGIKSWHMSVFNKWGQVIWETTKLDDGKPVEGWDGTYKGVAQPQGIYFWKLEVELINGTEWKGMTYDKKAPRRTGEIYLIR
ncbi:MAG: PKD domain-containing protein [Pedobacter sp.]|nr:MAG: PKD domain-containing protein [Pedobacter sp.]